MVNMAMPVATILYSFSGIVEVVVGGWVMEDFPRSVELVARDNNAGRAIAGEVFFAAFLCGLKSTLRRGVELVSRIAGSRPLGELPGVSEVPAQVVPCGSSGPGIGRSLGPHGKTAEGAVLQVGPPPRHRRPAKTLLSTFSSLLSRPQAARPHPPRGGW